MRADIKKIGIQFFYAQDHNFRHARVLLFDGESGLKSKKAQQILYNKYKLVVHADSGVKRGMAERAIRGKSESVLGIFRKLRKIKEVKTS